MPTESPVAPQQKPAWSSFSRHVPDPKLYARESEWYSRFITRAMTARYKLTVLLEEE